MDAILSLIVAVLMYGSIPVGTGVQVVAMVRRRGWGLVLSVVPVLPMAWFLAITWRAYRDGSTLWPLFLIQAARVASVWLWVVGRLLPGR